MDIKNEVLNVEKIKLFKAGEELGLINGKKIVLNNILTFMEEDIEYINNKMDVTNMDESNKEVFNGIKMAYAKIKKMVDEGLFDVELDDLERKNLMSKGVS